MPYAYDGGGNECRDPAPTAYMRTTSSGEGEVETGLDFFGARYYSGAQGRFTSVDPIWVKPDRMLDPQRLNLYAYGRNNPLRFTDPTGMDVMIGNCPGDKTVTQCFAAVQQGLRKEDRGHVHLVTGDGKNGFKKGQYGITVDADYKSSSKDFGTLQHLASDHSATAVVNFEPSGFQLQGNVGVRVGNQTSLATMTEVNGNTPVPMGQGLGGYTLYQLWGKPQFGVVYSPKPETQVFGLSDTATDMMVNFFHEIQHVFLGDFGRKPLAGQHDAPGVNAATKAAEQEALQNAKQQ